MEKFDKTGRSKDAKEAFDKAASKARELADQAGPYAQRASEAAGEFAQKMRPYAQRAGEYAAKGVGEAAQRMDKATGGKYSGKIDAVTEKVKEVLDPEHNKK